MDSGISTAARLHDDGLRERKVTLVTDPAVDPVDHDGDYQENVKAKQNDQDTKTYGRTPDGTGMYLFLIIFALILVPTCLLDNAPSLSCTRNP